MAVNTDHIFPVVDGELPPSPQSSAATPQLLFKKHKVLPHPGRDTSTAPRGPRPMVPTQRQDQTAATAAALNGALSAYASASAADVQSSSPRTLKHYARKMRSGPDLPPTPPAHSRTSSSSYSVLPSSTTSVQSPDRSAEDIPMKPTMPATPTKQMSPPTPDVTPPSATGPENRVKDAPVRTFVRDRDLSKGTNSSRAESFKTAREDTSSGDEEIGIHRPIAPSTRTSESTVRCLFVAGGVDEAAQNVNGFNGAMPARTIQSATASKRQSQSQPIGLGLGLESGSDRSSTPKSKSRHGAASHNPEWSAPRNDKVVQEWDGNHDRNVVVRKRQRPHPNTVGPHRKEVVEDVTVAPTNAAQAVRSMNLPKRILTFPSPNESSTQPTHQPKQEQLLASVAPTAVPMAPLSISSGSERGRRVSTISSKSTVSTVVETYSIDTLPLQRRRTLRHVRKQVGLRDSMSDMSPISSAPTSILDESNMQLQRRLTGHRLENRQEKALSGVTVASVGSRSARREILKAGAIPVLVVPNRRSSVTSISREPSLRSTSSRRSKTNQSVNSVPLSQFSSTKSKEYPPSVDRTGRRRGRAYSDSDGSAPGDQRTMDYPPVVPRRSSSLSAPTSRNASRSGSLTAESLKVHDEFLQSQLQVKQLDQRLALSQLSREDGLAKSPVEPPVEVTPVSTEVIKPEASLQTFGIPPPRVNVEEASPVEHRDNELHDNHGHACSRSPTQHDEALHRHLSPQNVPFSPASFDTAASHHSHTEVSEALAVSIYAHQNTSILVVDHSNRQSVSSDDSQPDRMTDSTGSSGSKVEMVSFSPRRQSRVPSHRALQQIDSAATPRSHPLFSMDDVDSPLRNPRVPPSPPAALAAPAAPAAPAPPPAPPAINFIPATPSGMTPATEKEPQRGNLFDEDLDNKPQSSVAKVFNRVMHRGRRTEYGPSASRSTGLIARTVSLSKLVQRKASLRRSKSLDRNRKRIVFDPGPADETRLHPLWRPASFQLRDDYRSDSESDSESSGSDSDEEYYRYPPVDNRPHGPRGPPMSRVVQAPRRSLSERMKRTFAIMPINDSFDSYPGTSEDAPERRTVRRTPSGNLRVVKHRSSVDSLGRRGGQETQQAYTSAQQPGHQGHPGHQDHQGKFWMPAVLRTPSLRKKETEAEDEAMVNNRSHEKHMAFPKFGENGLQSIPRRLSERRREKRSNELRRKISAPREVRDGVGDVIRHSNYRDAFTQAQMNSEPTA